MSTNNNNQPNDRATTTGSYFLFTVICIFVVGCGALITFRVPSIHTLLTSVEHAFWWILWAVAAIWVNTSIVYIFRDWLMRSLSWLLFGVLFIQLMLVVAHL